MRSDRPRNKTFAAAFAVGGLIVLMIQDTPNWDATIAGLICLFAFSGLWLLPQPRKSTVPRPRRMSVEIILSGTSKTPVPLDLLDGHPRALEWLSRGKPAHPWSIRRDRATGRK